MKWMSLHIGGQLWEVHIVPSNSPYLRADNGSPLFGCTYCEKSRIYLSKDMSEQARQDTLLHEILHASLFVSGGVNALDQVCKTPEQSENTEEQIILGLTNVLHRILKDLGFRFPKGPCLT